MALQFDIFVSYSQLAVFWPSLDEPFNAWSDKQVRDGYSWAPQSVSFKTPIESGVCTVEVVDVRGQRPRVASSIEVPFDVPKDGKIEVASISDGSVISVPSGKATLRYESLGGNRLRLTFIYAE